MYENLHRYIPIISPELTFVQKASALGLFSGELIFRGACYRKEFCVSKWVGLDKKNSLKQLAVTVHGLIFGRSRAYRRKDFCVGDLEGGGRGGLLSEFYGIFHEKISQNDLCLSYVNNNKQTFS